MTADQFAERMFSAASRAMATGYRGGNILQFGLNAARLKNPGPWRDKWGADQEWREGCERWLAEIEDEVSRLEKVRDRAQAVAT